jgi:hypothetical protein
MVVSFGALATSWNFRNALENLASTLKLAITTVSVRSKQIHIRHTVIASHIHRKLNV